MKILFVLFFFNNNFLVFFIYLFYLKDTPNGKMLNAKKFTLELVFEIKVNWAQHHSGVCDYMWSLYGCTMTFGTSLWAVQIANFNGTGCSEWWQCYQMEFGTLMAWTLFLLMSGYAGPYWSVTPSLSEKVVSRMRRFLDDVCDSTWAKVSFFNPTHQLLKRFDAEKRFTSTVKLQQTAD